MRLLEENDVATRFVAGESRSTENDLSVNGVIQSIDFALRWVSGQQGSRSMDASGLSTVCRDESGNSKET